MLIGAEIFWELLCVGQIATHKDYPVFQKTRFGWILSGQVANSKFGNAYSSCHLSTVGDLHEIISRFWQIKNNHCEATRTFSPDKLICEKLFVESTIRNSEGRFVVKLPVRNNMISRLGDSREIAKRRFFALERRLLKQPELYENYRKFMHEYQDLKHMYQIEEDDCIDVCYYLPHHAVLLRILARLLNYEWSSMPRVKLNQAIL